MRLDNNSSSSPATRGREMALRHRRRLCESTSQAAVKSQQITPALCQSQSISESPLRVTPTARSTGLERLVGSFFCEF